VSYLIDKFMHTPAKAVRSARALNSTFCVPLHVDEHSDSSSDSSDDCDVSLELISSGGSSGRSYIGSSFDDSLERCVPVAPHVGVPKVSARTAPVSIYTDRLRDRSALIKHTVPAKFR
jgi:hypothetical protein